MPIARAVGGALVALFATRHNGIATIRRPLAVGAARQRCAAIDALVHAVVALFRGRLHQLVSTARGQGAVRIARPVGARVLGRAEVARLAAGDNPVAADAVTGALGCVEAAQGQLVVGVRDVAFRLEHDDLVDVAGHQAVAAGDGRAVGRRRRVADGLAVAGRLRVVDAYLRRRSIQG